jgi:hypothetical protein
MKWPLAAALVAGLLASAPAMAQSGRAEATIQAPANTVKSLIINEMMNRGFSILGDTPSVITFGKITDNLVANLFFGTRAGGAPQARITYSMAEINGSTRVMGDAALVSNAGTGFERRTDMNSGDTLRDMQSMLYAVAAKSAPPTAASPQIGTDYFGLTEDELGAMAAKP